MSSCSNINIFFGSNHWSLQSLLSNNRHLHQPKMVPFNLNVKTLKSFSKNLKSSISSICSKKVGFNFKI